MRITVAGRPVADLTPIARPRRFVHRDEVLRLLATATMDPEFARDLDDSVDQTVDDTWEE